MEEMEMTKNEALKEHVRGHVKYPASKAELLQSCMVGEFPEEVEVRSSSMFGLALLDELIGRERVLVIDSYLPEEFEAAEMREVHLEAVGDAHAPSPHFVGLGEIREVMKSLELPFPREVRILAIPVSDPTTFSTEMTPAVAALVSEAAARARRIVNAWIPVSAASPESLC